MLIEKFSGPEVARQMRAARTRLRQLEGADASIAADVRRRIEKALLGSASVFAGSLPRRRIRQIARRSARLAWTEKLRTEGEAWPAFEVLDRQHIDDALALGRGVIVAPIHFGAYRTIGPGLAQIGYSVSFLADAVNIRFLTDQLSGGLGHYADACAGEYSELDGEGLRDAVQLVDSNDMMALWKLRQALGANRVVVMFPDGNSGADGRPNDKHCIPIAFMGQTIGVRAGIAALASVAGCPIVPAVMYDRGRERPALQLRPPIQRAEGERKRAFRVRAMTELFGFLEGWVRRWPHRWEEWLRLSEWLVRESAPLPAPGQLPSHIPAAARMALDPQIWVLDMGDGPRVVHIGTWNSLGRAPALLDLVGAAEAGMTVAQWLEGHADPDGAAALLVDFVRLGCVRVDDAQ